MDNFCLLFTQFLAMRKDCSLNLFPKRTKQKGDRLYFYPQEKKILKQEKTSRAPILPQNIPLFSGDNKTLYRTWRNNTSAISQIYLRKIE